MILVIPVLFLPIDLDRRIWIGAAIPAALGYTRLLHKWLVPKFVRRPLALRIIVTLNVLVVSAVNAALVPLGFENFGVLYFVIGAITALLLGRELALLTAVEAFVALLVIDLFTGNLITPWDWLNLAASGIGLTATVLAISAVMDHLRAQSWAAFRHNAVLLARENRRSAHLETLQRLAVRIASGLDVEGVCQAVWDGMREVMPTEALSIALYDETAGTRDRIFRLDDGERHSHPPLDDELMSYALHTREPILVRDMSKETRFPSIRWDSGQPIVSCLAAPMLIGDRRIGALSTQSYQPAGFDETDLRTITQVAAQAAIALANARTVELERRRADELTALQATTSDLAAELDLPTLLAEILKRAKALLDASSAEVALLAPAGDHLEIVVSQGMGDNYNGMHVPLGEGIMGRVAETGQPMIVDDYNTWPGRLPAIAPLIFASMGAPMLYRGKLLGVITLADSAHDRRFTPADLALLNQFSTQAATAVESARMYDLERRRGERQKALLEIAGIVTSTLEIGETIERIGEQIQRIIPADTYTLSLVDGETQTIEFLVDDGQRYPRQAYDLGQGLSGWVMRNGRTLRLGRVPEEAPALEIELLMLGNDRPSLSWLGVPLTATGQTLGLISVGSYSPHAFSGDDEDVARQIAAQAALAIANARVHAEVKEQARRDSLTGVYNHGHLLQALFEAVAESRESGGHVSLIMLDIDHFKHYNDTYGHMAGDEVLRLTVQAIRAHVKRTDLVGRWGGEEFAIGLPNATLGQAHDVAKRVQLTLAAMTLTVHGQAVPIPTVSQGIATFPVHTAHASDLVDVADHALYQAKRLGRNQICLADTDAKPSSPTVMPSLSPR